MGKTTCSAAYALSLAERGLRTLLVSTDPAHSLGDLLGVRVGMRPSRLKGGSTSGRSIRKGLSTGIWRR